MNNKTQHKPARIALVGLGGHGRTIQQASANAPSLEVVGVYDPVVDEAQAAAERFGCEAATSYEALLAHDDLDGVALCTPNHIHRVQAEAAFAAGLDVFIEKPIANTVADGLAMVEAAEQAGQILMVGHNMRRNRSARLAKEMIEGGTLGEIVSIEIHFSADNTRYMPVDAWRLCPDQCPLMPVMQLAIHGIDLAHYWDAPIEHIYAHARSVTTQPNVIDSTTASFRTASGTLGTLVSHYCTQVLFEMRVAGTEGSLVTSPHSLWHRSCADNDRSGGGPAATHDFRAFDNESYTLQMEAFGHAIHTRETPETDGRGGVQALAVVEAMMQSIEADAPVHIQHVYPQAHAE